MPERLTNSIIPTMWLIAAAAKEGITAKDLCEVAKLDPVWLGDPEHRVPTAVNERMLAEVVRRTENEMYWVRPMQADEGAKENAAWYIFFNSPTLGDALGKSESLYRLVSDVTYPAFHEIGEECVLRLSAKRQNYDWSDYLIDWALSGWWSIMIALVGPTLKLKEVRLAKPPSDRETFYPKFYNAPVRFGQQHNELVFDPKYLDLPNVREVVDTDLQALLMRLSAPKMAQTPSGSEFEIAMNETIQHELIHRRPTLSGVAKRLNMSPRTLQRKLAQIGFSFSDMVQETRRTLAANYLQQPDLNVTEVAYLLKFKDIRSLTMAFQRWYGVSPTEFRKTNRA